MDFQMMMAMDIAKRSHEGQLRKYTGDPYLTHPFSVAGLVHSVVSDDNMVIAALLHDVVEDSECTIETVNGLFGEDVASLVWGLTDQSKLTDGNRAERKRIDREHTIKQSHRVHTIKLADLIDNTKTITSYDKGFAKVYMAEKQLLLPHLSDGDFKLFVLAKRMVHDWYHPVEKTPHIFSATIN